MIIIYIYQKKMENLILIIHNLINNYKFHKYLNKIKIIYFLYMIKSIYKVLKKLVLLVLLVLVHKYLVVKIYKVKNLLMKRFKEKRVFLIVYVEEQKNIYHIFF